MPPSIAYAVPALVFVATLYVAEEYAFSELSTAILAALVPSALTACWQWAKSKNDAVIEVREKLLKHMDSQDEAMRTVLRNDLEAYHRRFVARGSITTREHELAYATYKAYHKELHANGTGTKLWEEINELPIID